MIKRAALPTLALALTAVSINPAFANLTAEDVQYQISKAAILAENSPVNVRVEPGGHVVISRYRNVKANDNDCKIEAALIAKTLMEADPSISLISIYFFGKTAQSPVRQIDITTGDIKAFGSGATDKAQFLSSLQIKFPNLDPQQRIASALQGVQPSINRKFDIVIARDTIKVNTVLPAETDSRNAKLEALRVAERVKASYQGAPKKIVVQFNDPDSAEDRVISFDPAAMKELEINLTKVFEPISMVVTEHVQNELVAGPGVMQEARADAIGEIGELQKKKVSCGELIQQFTDIEQQVKNGADENQITTLLGKLVGQIHDKQKELKDAQAVASKKVAKAPEPTGPAAPMPTSWPNRRILSNIFGEIPDKGRIQADPDGYLNELMHRMNPSVAKTPDARQYKVALLQYFAMSLQQMGRPEQTQRVLRQLAQVQSH